MTQNMLAVGAVGSKYGSVDFAGATYLFRMEANGSLTLRKTITAEDHDSDDHFGQVVSLSTDKLAIGSRSDSGGNSFAGAVYLFDLKNEQSAESILSNPNSIGLYTSSDVHSIISQTKNASIEDGKQLVLSNLASYSLVSQSAFDQAILDANTSAEQKLAEAKNLFKKIGIDEGKSLIQADPNTYGLVTQAQYDKAMEKYPSMDINATPYTVGWYYMPSRGWLFTSNTAYPYIFDSNTGGWLYFETGNKKPRFYEYGNKKWFEMTEEE